MGWFSKKMNIGEGKKYDVSQISKDGVTQEEAVKNNKSLASCNGTKASWYHPISKVNKLLSFSFL